MKSGMKYRIAALLLCLAPAAALARTDYVPSGTCDGWPRAPIGMASGFCAGLIVAPPADFEKRTILSPRVL